MAAPTATASSISTGPAILPSPIIGLALLTVVLATLAERALGILPAQYVAAAAYLIFVAASLKQLGRRERILLTVALILTALAILSQADPLATLLSGLDTATYMATFLLTLGMLRDAAATSPSVRDCGIYLTQQPPGRRYVALHIGGHLLGLLLNFGVLNLLGPMIRRGVESGDPALSEIREQRQISAVMRGFPTILLWSPATITQALMIGLLPGLEPATLLTLGLVLTGLMLLVGWTEDRIRWHKFQRARANIVRPAPPPAPLRAISGMALVCLGLVVSVALVKFGLDIPIVAALITAIPCFVLLWIALQNFGLGAATALAVGGQRLKRIVTVSFPAATPETFTLSSSSFIGVMIAALLPPEWIASAIQPLEAYPILLVAVIIAIVPIAAQIAFNPIISVVVLGAALIRVPDLPIDPTTLALALASGWMLALPSSPFSIPSLILGRVLDRPGTQLSWRWNGLYTLAAYATVLIFIAAVRLI
ncbi:hypothetical protein [Oceanibaculum pacificum]|uniref:Citrate transporter-like domain-containing protein n=1 Tax=Oceanibaculum pacificum TaxID=580166 RepID=A0A154WFR8_9PROT|nr:hypothetical protein [Oceanibaculum pacificum]KZD12373.1 hypothetical protein AUP43_16605 [Oceanibaculum pacificum]